MSRSHRIFGKSARAGLLGLAAALLASTAMAEPKPAAAVAVPGKPALFLGTYDIGQLGYTTEEYFLSGAAQSYKLTGAATADGRWDAQADGSAPYATRLVVVRPSDPAKFNGTVVVEWLNVSAGADGAPDWNVMHRELVRSGYAYVGVSAQKVGVEGGTSQGIGQPLKKTNPERYAKLSHPGDAYAYDIFSQAGASLRRADGPLGPLKPKRLIGVGESQSAVFLTTYVNAVDPLAKVYDGFMINSRFGPGAALDGRSMMAAGDTLPKAVKLRPDLRVPTMTVVTETDLLSTRLPGFLAARQPDTGKLRTWEIAGAAHADNYLFKAGYIDSGSAPLTALAAAYAPIKDAPGGALDKPMNPGQPHHYVLKAGLVGLDQWLATGKAPAHAQPIEVAAGPPASFVTDANGIAKGGVRTPWVDTPTARISGVGNSGGVLGFLAGVGEPYDTATLKRLYPGGEADYLKKFEASLDAAIKGGFILPADREEILGLAKISYGR